VKRLADLTAVDLAAHPVWRYEGGSGGDALVVPTKRKTLSQGDDEIFLAFTEFELFDSSRHAGFCFPADDSGIDYLQPVIVTATRHVSFWFDEPVGADDLSAQWAALGKQLREIFPVTFRCTVPVDGKHVTGRIDGVESPPQEVEFPQPERLGRMAPQPPERAPLTARPIEIRRGVGPPSTRTARRRKAEWTVEFTQGPIRGTGITGDVSPRGMFVRSNQIPGTGPMVKLTVNLPEGRKLVLTGKVVRSAEENPPGFGLRLAEDVPGYDELLARLRDKPKG
jgi:hypothetical protein